MSDNNNKSVTIGTKVPPRFKEIIEEYISLDSHVSIGDFLRNAAREKIQRDAPHLMEKLLSDENAD